MWPPRAPCRALLLTSSQWTRPLLAVGASVTCRLFQSSNPNTTKWSSKHPPLKSSDSILIHSLVPCTDSASTRRWKQGHTGEQGPLLGPRCSPGFPSPRGSRRNARISSFLSSARLSLTVLLSPAAGGPLAQKLLPPHSSERSPRNCVPPPQLRCVSDFLTNVRNSKNGFQDGEHRRRHLVPKPPFSQSNESAPSQQADSPCTPHGLAPGLVTAGDTVLRKPGRAGSPALHGGCEGPLLLTGQAPRPWLVAENPSSSWVKVLLSCF